MATGLSWGAAGGAATVSGEVGPAAFEIVRPSATTSALPVWQGLNGGASWQGGSPPGPVPRRFATSEAATRPAARSEEAARPACQKASSGIA